MSKKQRYTTEYRITLIIQGGPGTGYLTSEKTLPQVQSSEVAFAEAKRAFDNTLGVVGVRVEQVRALWTRKE